MKEDMARKEKKGRMEEEKERKKNGRQEGNKMAESHNHKLITAGHTVSTC